MPYSCQYHKKFYGHEQYYRRNAPHKIDGKLCCGYCYNRITPHRNIYSNRGDSSDPPVFADNRIDRRMYKYYKDRKMQRIQQNQQDNQSEYESHDEFSHDEIEDNDDTNDYETDSFVVADDVVEFEDEIDDEIDDEYNNDSDNNDEEHDEEHDDDYDDTDNDADNEGELITSRQIKEIINVDTLTIIDDKQTDKQNDKQNNIDRIVDHIVTKDADYNMNINNEDTDTDNETKHLSKKRKYDQIIGKNHALEERRQQLINDQLYWENLSQKCVRSLLDNPENTINLITMIKDANNRIAELKCEISIIDTM